MKVEGIAFWILIAASILIAIWILIGSPGMAEAAFTLTMFSIGEIALLWRNFYAFKADTNAKLKSIEDKVDKILEK